MASEWKEYPLGEICSLITDGKHGDCRNEEGSGYYFLSVKDVFDDRMVYDNARQIVKEDFAETHNRTNLEPGDVLFTNTGTIGRMAIAPDDPKTARTTFQKSVAILKPRQNLVLSRFLYFTLKCENTRLSDFASGTTQKNLLLKDLRAFKVRIPPHSEQNRIAHILGTLDDKIELNRRMNATLEAMARALFKSWFIDFDPVRRNMDMKGKNRSSPGAANAESDVLFPSAFQDSVVGHVPKGWTVETVGEVVACVGGSTPSTAEPKFWEGGMHHWTTPKDFSSLQVPVLIDTDRRITDAGIAKISSGLLPVGTLLLSSRAPVGYLAISALPVAINQGFIAMKCNEIASNYFMLNWCQENMAEIESRATGTTFAEISKQNFRPIPIVMPPARIMVSFTSKVAPLYAQITANLYQSRTLATLRDSLLPQLLSGVPSCI